MRRKASYTDRPLTEEERIFAEKRHDLMYRYMRIHELDIDEWYDRLIIPYLQAVKKYHEYKKLQSYKFEQIFFRTLDSARSNYWRELNRKKRCPEGGVWSLEGLCSNNDYELSFMHYLYTFDVNGKLIEVKPECKIRFPNVQYDEIYFSPEHLEWSLCKLNKKTGKLVPVTEKPLMKLELKGEESFFSSSFR